MSNLINIMDMQKTLQINNLYNEIINLNDKSSERGLFLTEEDVYDLVETQTKSLKDNERIEFGGKTVTNLIEKFYTSTFMSPSNYAQNLNELLETFYYFKTEFNDKISDKDLFELMKELFDESCFGSIELLQGRDLEIILRYMKNGETDYMHLKPEDNYNAKPDTEPDEEYIL